MDVTKLTAVECCANCAYFLPTDGDRGFCRRYPPSQPTPQGRWPLCVVTDWCGEYKKETS